MALLGNYGFQTIAEDEFDFNFEIPDNCGYTTDYDSGKNINTISVALNQGESQPSDNYNKESLTFNSVNGVLQVYFEETFNSVTVRRPKISIDSNDY